MRLRDFRLSQLLCVTKAAKIVNFKLKKHQNPFWSGLHPDPAERAYDYLQPYSRLICVVYTHLYFWQYTTDVSPCVYSVETGNWCFKSHKGCSNEKNSRQ